MGINWKVRLQNRIKTLTKIRDGRQECLDLFPGDETFYKQVQDSQLALDMAKARLRDLTAEKSS
jgi:hypothetical protein